MFFYVLKLICRDKLILTLYNLKDFDTDVPVSWNQSVVDISIIYICMKVHVYCNHVCEIYNTCFNVCINANVSRPCWCSVSLLNFLL